MSKYLGQLVTVFSGMNGAELAKGRVVAFTEGTHTLYVMNPQTGHETSIMIQEDTLVKVLTN
ncbi:hypothetical protein QP794_24380 [Paenibacillus sp. UMB7766-LJ446]|uniref:hypothetical protein n=1 Tax=Paenibacillus sp. UMB7766-LJ446 TaxID=3046313 RepID=UPI00255169E5|nr:hypothetical protein [Paenibacillus sp. UMB7766-LJ446]MDK8193229.1 hypothetical protein [Paenibacillus sp. UMB7766-LJ446]